MTTLIPISPSKRGLFAIVDDEDANALLHHTWWVKPARYAFTVVGGKNIYMHRMILAPERWQVVDHINRNPLDNRRCNLRVCTQSQNATNRPARSSNGFRGVISMFRNPGWKYHYAKRYRAVVVKHSKAVAKGPWRPDPAEAARDYDRLALPIHGEFAVLNFPDEVVS